MLDSLALTGQPFQLLLAVSLVLLWVYQDSPELKFLVLFHLLSSAAEMLWLMTSASGPFLFGGEVWQFQLLLLSNLIKVLLLLVAVSFRFSLLCLSLGQVLVAYGLLMLLQLPGLLQFEAAVDQQSLFQDGYQIASQIVRIGLLIALSYPSIGILKKRLRAD